MKRFAAALLLLQTACLCPPPMQPPRTSSSEPVTVSYSSDLRTAYGAALRAVVKADLSVELKDVDAGLVKTEWHLSYSGLSVRGTEHRRIRFTILLVDGVATVKPESEFETVMGPNSSGWNPDAGAMTDVEAAAYKHLAETLSTELHSAPAK